MSNTHPIPGRRPVGAGETCVPRAYRVGPAEWVVVFYSLTPKQGDFWRAEFPHFWARNDRREDVWRVAIDGAVPGGAYLFEGQMCAEQTLELVYPRGGRFTPGWIEVPSRDARRSRPTTATAPSRDLLIEVTRG